MHTIMMAAYTNYRRDPRVKREAECLVEAGYSVVFLARRQPGEPTRETIAGVDVIKTRGVKNTRTSVLLYVLDYGIFFLAIALHLLRHPLRYKLVHINNMPDFLVFATWLPRLLGCPVILDVHDLMPELYQEKFGAGKKPRIIQMLEFQERWAGRFASAVLTVEERLKTILSARGIPRDKIHVLMNLPNEQIFKPRAPAVVKEMGAPFVIVYHGTLAHRLGLDIAIEAVARARLRVSHIELRIIGAGEARDRLMELRNHLGLRDVVTFSEGFVRVEEVPSMIEDADVGLIPLRISQGTDIMLPTKLLEYVAMGIPCIAPRTGTIARYFDDNMVHFFEAGNVESLADAIVSLHERPERRAALARGAVEGFGKTYRWSEHKKVYLKLVERLIQGAA